MNEAAAIWAGHLIGELQEQPGEPW